MILKHFLLRMMLLSLGAGLLGSGAAILISSNMGSDPFSVFMQGIASHTPLTIGQSSVGTSMFYAIIVFFWNRRLLRFGSVVSIAALGPIIDVLLITLQPLSLAELDMTLRFVCILTSCLCLGLGLSSIYQAKLGFLPNDILPILIAKKWGKTFRNVRIGYDLTTVLLGFLLGGVVGIGTLLCALSVGPLIVLFNHWYAKRLPTF